MKTTIVFVFIFIIIVANIVGGCASLRAFLQNEEDDIVPTPENQLWQAAKKSNWLATLSIIGIAAGVFAMVNGATKIGMASVAGCSVSLFMSLAVARFALWMAVFGLIGSIAAALFSILTRRKALIEIILGVQKAKATYAFDNSTGPLRDELTKQSKTTRKIVGNLKNELRLKGKI